MIDHIKPSKFILQILLTGLYIAQVQAISLPNLQDPDDKTSSELEYQQQDTTAHASSHAAGDTLNQNALTHDSAHSTEDTEALSPEDLQEHRNKFKTSKFHHTQAAELITKRTGLNHKEPWEIVMRQAELAARSKDFDMAEGLYGHAFMLGPPEEAHKQGYLELANMYEQAGEIAKMAAVYEKFAQKFKDDARLAQIFIRLGHLYREMGAYNMAISRFYNVLNVSISIDADGVETYKEISLQARRDIADTYFIMGNFAEAEKFYNRLLMLDLEPEDQLHVSYRKNYLNYLQEEYSAAAAGLKEFLRQHPTSEFAPESYYMLANAFNQLNEPMKAVRQVLKLLKSQHKIAPENMALWQYWRKRTANQLAEKFYKQNDYLSAIKIYQAMAPVSRNPSWQWPVVYKIGLCFERLHMYPKAQESYRLIASGEAWKDIQFTMTPTLLSLKEMAAWRLEHLEWDTATKSRIKGILEIAGQHSNTAMGLEDDASTDTPKVN